MQNQHNILQFLHNLQGEKKSGESYFLLNFEALFMIIISNVQSEIFEGQDL